MPEQYRINERVRVIVEGPVVHHALCESPYPSELTVAVPMDGGTYQVTVPLVGAVTIERLAPDVQPGQVWQDHAGDLWWSVRVIAADAPHTMMLPGELHDLRAVGDSMLSPEDVNRRYGPITRVYPPAPAADTTSGQAEETSPGQADEPRLMLDDVWEDRVGDIWRVVADATAVGGLGLTLVRNGALITWTDVVSSSGPLVLLERAGCRRTTATPTAGQLRPGQIVSCEEWEDDAPVTITDSRRVIVDDACRLEVEYRPLGWISKITRTAAPDARITLWTGRAVTA